MGDWTAIALVLAGVATACAGTCAAMLLHVRRSAGERQRELELQVETLRESMEILEGRVADGLDALQSGEMAPHVSEVAAMKEDAAPRDEDVLAPELQAVIAAAAVACAGRTARVRSVKLMSGTRASAWSQQGRMLVQTSHNVRGKA